MPLRPGPEAVQLARLVERALKQSGALDAEALCVIAGRKVRAAAQAAAVAVASCVQHYSAGVGTTLQCARSGPWWEPNRRMHSGSIGCVHGAPSA